MTVQELHGLIEALIAENMGAYQCEMATEYGFLQIRELRYLLSQGSIASIGIIDVSRNINNSRFGKKVEC